jgi:hypothetical protein
MGITICNPQKGRLETVDIEFTEDNTTWFNKCSAASDIRMITDFDGRILITQLDYTHPIWICDVSRADIGYSQIRAKQLRRRYE